MSFAALSLASAASARVLLVGNYHGIAGKYRTIQAAVNVAKPGDWILIGPGDYKTSSSRAPKGGSTFPAAVLITKPRLRLRGMNRNTVIVDGTKPGSSACSSKKAAQNFGPASKHGPQGLNGIMVWKANDVWVQNLTACNFLGGSGGDGVTGNEIWWNGGAGSAQIGGWGYNGSYLNATSQFFQNENTSAMYGVFTSNWDGGTWNQAYASNFNDSGFYIGACQQQCNQTVNHIWSEFSALGYSGSNSGGQLVIENSQFDQNETGFSTNSQNGDNPPPQDGACPNNGISPITHTHSCWVFMHNNVHDNNNPNVPSVGSAAAGPVGTGVSAAGARDDTFMDNTISNNNAWGVILVPYLDSGPPCTGGTPNGLGQGSCLFDEWGDALVNNVFSHNGSYGHPTNGDFDQLNFENGHPTDCYSGNTEAGGGSLSPDAATLQAEHPTCDGSAAPANTNPPFLAEVLCDSQVELSPGTPAACPTGAYPRRQFVHPHALPPARELPTMPNPCVGVPANPWCTAHKQRPRA
ncbi:MAG TPA: hypothetical protein VMP89_15445 [Solirubrobacteraceae bacterium]|nr:hypothetical protein [Solirubrobacteraceae bacterium]